MFDNPKCITTTHTRAQWYGSLQNQIGQNHDVHAVYLLARTLSVTLTLPYVLVA